MHHHATISLKPSSSNSITHHHHALLSPIFQNPSFLIIPPLCRKKNLRCCSIRGIEIPVTKLNNNNINNSNGSTKLTSISAVKDVDIATLGNLCVDIVLNVPQLPPKPLPQRQAYMEHLSKSPPDKRYWEAGGNCNVAIAAARLGLHCISIGHVGDEIYGRFLIDVLSDEGISIVGMNQQSEALNLSSSDNETLLCWVLVDPLQRHGFCSHADFRADPAFSWMSSLSTEVKMAIRKSKILFCNGYDFDELSPSLLESALEYAVESGTSIFFDPGPRGKSLIAGRPEEQRAIGKLLRMSEVLLLTSDEAASLTGINDPILAGQELLKNGVCTKWVIVKMGPKGSILITKSSITCSPAFKVNIIDTVGCGDSFVAAVAFGFIHDLPLSYTLTLANAVGAATATGCGAGRNVASLGKVLELLKESNLNEDDKFWDEILNDNVNSQDKTVVSKMVVNGNSQVNRVSLQKVVSEVLPKLEFATEKVVAPSNR
ncbi:probable fructokinase-4 [Lycium barbarum]|uniref:probable fructokinase-4 n=1 Tax=Lycium barbarum TaxID=112863 RepID=UPI00293F271C|nr:probable fructokinase-4 [Lycium barbarum]